jgi:hypothetical protein
VSLTIPEIVVLSQLTSSVNPLTSAQTSMINDILATAYVKWATTGTGYSAQVGTPPRCTWLQYLVVSVLDNYLLEAIDLC